MKIKIRNFIAEIKKTKTNGFVAVVRQINKNYDGKMEEDFFAAKFDFKTENGAKNWAIRIIN